MTFYESNRDVRPVGDEVAEYVTEPEPVPPEPPRPHDEESETEPAEGAAAETPGEPAAP